MKTGSLICLAIFVLGLFLAIAQLWFAPMSWEVFTKVALTLLALFLAASGITLVKNEYLEERKMKDSDYID